ACRAELVRGLGRDAEAARGVLAVHDREVRLELGLQGREQRFQGVAARLPHHVTNEEDAEVVEVGAHGLAQGTQKSVGGTQVPPTDRSSLSKESEGRSRSPAPCERCLSASP